MVIKHTRQISHNCHTLIRRCSPQHDLRLEEKIASYLRGAEGVISGQDDTRRMVSQQFMSGALW